MGIDFLDIMYRVEKELGIRFVREDFDFKPGGKYLVGEFYDLVESKVCTVSKEILDSQTFQGKTFNDVKKTLANGLGLFETDGWTKETTLQQLYKQIPEDERKKTWRIFRSQARTIEETTITRIIEEKANAGFNMAWTEYVVFFILPLTLNLMLNRGEAVFFGSIILAVLATFFWLKITGYRCRLCVPRLTLGEITDKMISQRRSGLKEDGSPYTRDEIEAVVKAVLCEALAVKPEDVTPEADLVRDLGME